MKSNDPALDYLYKSEPGVRFADTFPELALQVDAAMEQAGADKRQLPFIRNQNTDATPICNAIRALDAQVTMHQAAKWPDDKTFDLRKLNSRRRRSAHLFGNRRGGKRGKRKTP
jgi:hypothetical protein